MNFRHPIPRSGKPIKQISAKRLKKLGGKMPFSSIEKRTKPKRGKAAVVRRRRTKKDFARIYGSKARVEFVKSLPCSACGVVGYSENAHLTPVGEKGTGYKGDYRFSAPLCGPRRLDPRMGAISPTYPGCHRVHDERSDKFAEFFPDFDPEKVARETEELFRASLGSAPGGQT